MTRTPVIDKLVRGAIERCRERVTAARAGGRPPGPAQQVVGGTSFTSHVKRSRGL
ncbi:MAG TPA: hypothetical protein VMB35_09530 [Methanomicrobiales archaeon]|nr:hypothetical protein [Methanomicrobiales archaeon]